MDIGPVLDLEDVVGGKVCALVSRIEPRDYADVAAALQRYGPGQLIPVCPAAGSGLTGRDFADAGLRLDQMTDTRFAGAGLSQADVTALREQFAGWPRDAEATGRQLQAGNAAEPQPGPGTGRAVAGVSRVRMTLAPAGPQQRFGQDRAAEADRDDPQAKS